MRTLRSAVGAAFAGLMLVVHGNASAQETQAAQVEEGQPAVAEPAPAPVQITEGEKPEEIVVTGFRRALGAALDRKRDEIGSVDAILAEDIADFPDLNLAESIQRVPGVSITRDAGEGRQITVRGLGPQFTRVRINGMEAMSANGGTDAAGGANRDRSFDFNTFASELFSSVAVRKTASADTEEGSLGATVDLRTARPFDYQGFTIATNVQESFNDIRRNFDPRAAFLISNTFADGRMGALLSLAYTDRSLLDEGSSAVRFQNSFNGPLPADPTMRTPAGAFTALDPSFPAGGPSLDQLNAAFRPRIPRYDIYEQEMQRTGVTTSFQWWATEKTLLTLDGLFARLDAERSEQFLEAPVFSTNGANAIGAVRPRNAVIDRNGTLVFGLFDNVDIRSEARFDELRTDFRHLTLDVAHDFTDRVRLHGLVGYSDSKNKNPVQTTVLFDRADVDGFSFDYRGNDRLPRFSFGDADVTSPEGFTVSQIRLRPQSSLNRFESAGFELEWDATSILTLKAGPQWKRFRFESKAKQRSNGTMQSQESVIPADVAATPIGRLTENTGFSGKLDSPSGNVKDFIVPDVDRAERVLGLNDRSRFPLGVEPVLGSNYTVEEQTLGAFVQADLNTDLFGLPLRVSAGVRRVRTEQNSEGLALAALGARQAVVKTKADRGYGDTLPSINASLALTDTLLLRAAAAKVLARPNGSGQNNGLGILAPTTSISIAGSNKSLSAGNPKLDPFRAKAYDLSLEWYFAEESLLSVALFYKKIDSFVQIVRTSGNFSSNPLGLADSVALAACPAGTAPADCLAGWDFNLPRNTDGGDLRGIEVSYQQPLRFLPGPLANLGVLLNYTGVESEIDYLGATGEVDQRNDLTGLSKSAYNATLYWEGERVSARVSAAYRDDYLTTVPGRNFNDVEGTASTTSIDASFAWSLNNRLSLTFEALNLTDEFQDQSVDSRGDRSSFYHHQGRQFLAGARYKF